MDEKTDPPVLPETDDAGQTLPGSRVLPADEDRLPPETGNDVGAAPGDTRVLFIEDGRRRRREGVFENE